MRLQYGAVLLAQRRHTSADKSQLDSTLGSGYGEGGARYDHCSHVHGLARGATTKVMWQRC